MEFWGVEVKAGELLKVKPDGYSIIHLSQAALGESKKEKGNESATLFVKINRKKIVLGTLSYENIPQLSFDLVFEKEVELSHSLKNGSIYVCGYQSVLPDDDEEDMYSDDLEDEPVPLVSADNAVQLNANAKPATAKSNVAKPGSSSKQKVTPVQPSKHNKADNESDDDDDSDDDEDESHEEDESEEGMSVDEDSDDEDDSESEDEETPKKAEKGTKRPNDSAAKTPVPSKKQKSAFPQKTEGKRGGHTATPHPAKGAAKASANGNNTKPDSKIWWQV